VTTLRTTLQPASSSPARARAFVTSALTTWDADALIPTATLLTSELVTNAYLHAHTGIELRVVRTDAGIRFEVFDTSPQDPDPRAVAELACHGRGLRLVDQLATSWGVAPVSPLGKTVWFELGR
jgi:anti-sigma regulatory factor (Ser/Thr protein kinase)